MIDLPAWETIGLRLLGIACGLVAWFVTQRMIGQRHLEGGGIYDHLHRLTAAGNAWLHVHPGAARAALIASSLGVDAVSLFVLGYAVLGPSFSPFWGLLCLFGLRQASQAVVALPAPSGIIWRDPGFPSLFVTYAVGNDFFFFRSHRAGRLWRHSDRQPRHARPHGCRDPAGGVADAGGDRLAGALDARRADGTVRRAAGRFGVLARVGKPLKAPF